jgi:hypothetical protein
MALPGECVNDVITNCIECGDELVIHVCRSNAGYYIGFFCDECGPYSRESGYYTTSNAAQVALDSGNYGR